MLHRIVASVLLPVVPLTAACHRYTAVASPSDYITAQQPARVWVTRADNSVAVVEGPRFIGDTLTGFISGEFSELPPSTIKQVRARQPARGRNILAAAAAAVAGAGVVWLLTRSPGDPVTCTDDDDDGSPPTCAPRPMRVRK